MKRVDERPRSAGAGGERGDAAGRARLRRVGVEHVRATVQVKQSDQTLPIASMPVRYESPVSMQGRFRLEARDIITNVTVYGPPDKIALIRDGKFIPYAVLEIKSSDIGRGSQQRTLRYVLPEGVSVVTEDRNREFDFTVRTRRLEAIYDDVADGRTRA